MKRKLYASPYPSYEVYTQSPSKPPMNGENTTTQTSSSTNLTPPVHPNRTTTSPMSLFTSSFPSSFCQDPSLAEDMALRCELRELNHPFPPDGTPPTGSEEVDDGSILVMEMASLLYLGKIQQTWHLRRRSIRNTEPLQQLWQVGAAMLQHNFPMAFYHLQTLQSSPPQPLSSQIIKEIGDAYRCRVLQTLSRAYHKMDEKFAAEQLGLSTEDLKGFLSERGWELENSYWIPPKKKKRAVQQQQQQNVVRSSAAERIGILTNIVSFMEKNRMNA